MSPCSDVSVQKCGSVDKEECEYVPGPDVCTTVEEEKCDKVWGLFALA